MKKIIISICIVALSLSICVAIPVGTAFAASNENDYRSLFVMDYDTGTVVQEENADTPYPIASMVKIMTLALTFDAIEKGDLSYDEKITVSEYAAGMGGSQLFLDANAEYPVTDLIKGVVVCSANDAATALGERIAGNIDAFVGKMNQYAKELGMNNTVFCNATGLPNSGEQYSTARDVSLMMRKVLSYPKYYEYSKVWMEDYSHPDGRKTEIVNTNKLIRFMPECDGGKTGFTNEAGFCLSATAKQGDTRVIATLLGAKDGKARFRKVSESLKSALAKYETKIYLHKNEAFDFPSDDIQRAKNTTASLYCKENVASFGEKRTDTNKLEIVLFDSLKAPIKADSEIGKIYLVGETGERLKEYALYTSKDIDKKTFLDYLQSIVNNRYFR